MVGIFHGASDGGGGSAQFYLDGIPGALETIGGDLQDAGGDDGLWYIGTTRGPASGFSWDGLLDEIAIYNRALTPVEIQNHIALANIPEPTSSALLGLLGIASLLRRKRRRLV